MLVNNAGIYYPDAKPSEFTKIPGLNTFITDIINVNVLAPTRMVALILPGMEEKERGIIINLSAGEALSPAPYTALFNATKIYVDYLARGLYEEYKDKNILQMSLMPMLVRTKMRKHYFDYKWLNDWIFPTPEVYVRSALLEVPKEVRSTGYFPHKCIAFCIHIINFVSYVIGTDFMVKIYYYFYRWHIKDIERREAMKQNEEKSTKDDQSKKAD